MSSRKRPLLFLLLLVPAPSVGVLFSLHLSPGTFGSIVWGASKVWILVVPLAHRFLVARKPPSFSPLRRGGLGAALLSGVLLAAAVVGGFLAARGAIRPEDVRRVAEEAGIAGPGRYLALALWLTLVNALLEEFVWRWFVFRRSEDLTGSRLAAIVLSALFFTIHHVVALAAYFGPVPTLLGSAAVFSAGAVWSALYARTRSVWPPYVSHVLADVAVFAVGYHLLYG